MSKQTRRNKRIWRWSIIILVVLLLISYFVSQNNKKIDPVAIADVEVSELTAHLKGNLESEIKLIEYSDFQCPACSAAAPQVDALVEEYGDKFQFEFRHFPLRSIHPNAQLAAQAAEAAGIQGKFWEMHDKLFENQSEWSQSFNPERYFRSYAKELGLNVDRFRYDLDSDEVKDVVNLQFNEAMELGLPGTPSFVLNGEQIDINEFIIEQLNDTEAIIEEVTE